MISFVILQVIKKIGARLAELANTVQPAWEQGIDPPAASETVCVKEMFSSQIQMAVAAGAASPKPKCKASRHGKASKCDSNDSRECAEKEASAREEQVVAEFVGTVREARAAFCLPAAALSELRQDGPAGRWAQLAYEMCDMKTCKEVAQLALHRQVWCRLAIECLPPEQRSQGAHQRCAVLRRCVAALIHTSPSVCEAAFMHTQPDWRGQLTTKDTHHDGMTGKQLVGDSNVTSTDTWSPVRLPHKPRQGPATPSLPTPPTPPASESDGAHGGGSAWQECDVASKADHATSGGQGRFDQDGGRYQDGGWGRGRYCKPCWAVCGRGDECGHGDEQDPPIRDEPAEISEFSQWGSEFRRNRVGVAQLPLLVDLLPALPPLPSDGPLSSACVLMQCLREMDEKWRRVAFLRILLHPMLLSHHVLSPQGVSRDGNARASPIVAHTAADRLARPAQGEGPAQDAGKVRAEAREEGEVSASDGVSSRTQSLLMALDPRDVILCGALWLVVRHARDASRDAGEQDRAQGRGGSKGGKRQGAMSHAQVSALAAVVAFPQGAYRAWLDSVLQNVDGRDAGNDDRLMINNLNHCSCLSVVLLWLNALNDALGQPFPRQPLAVLSPRLLVVRSQDAFLCALDPCLASMLAFVSYFMLSDLCIIGYHTRAPARASDALFLCI